MLLISKGLLSFSCHCNWDFLLFALYCCTFSDLYPIPTTGREHKQVKFFGLRHHDVRGSMEPMLYLLVIGLQLYFQQKPSKQPNPPMRDRSLSGSMRTSPQSQLSVYDTGVTVGPMCVTYCPPLAIQVDLQTPIVAWWSTHQSGCTCRWHRTNLCM